MSTESAVIDARDPGAWVRRLVSAGDLAPRHGLLDGVWIVTVLLPLMFGALNGDVGAGLVALAVTMAAGFALRSNPTASLLVPVLTRAAVAAIAFGFLYGEFFGRSFGPVPLSRVETVMWVWYAALALVLVQAAANIAAGILRSTRESTRENAWVAVRDFAVIVAAALLAWSIAWLATVAELALLSRLLDESTLSEIVVVATFYVVYAILLAGAALLADSGLKLVYRAGDVPQ